MSVSSVCEVFLYLTKKGLTLYSAGIHSYSEPKQGRVRLEVRSVVDVIDRPGDFITLGSV